MDIALEIVALIALIIFIILAIWLIVTLNEFKKLSNEAQKSLHVITDDIRGMKNQFSSVMNDVSDLKLRVMHTLDEVSELKAKAVTSFSNIDDAVHEVKMISRGLESDASMVFQVLKPVADISNFFYGQLAKPLSQAAGVVTAATKAYKMFMNVAMRRKSK